MKKLIKVFLIGLMLVTVPACKRFPGTYECSWYGELEGQAIVEGLAVTIENKYVVTEKGQLNLPDIWVNSKDYDKATLGSVLIRTVSDNNVYIQSVAKIDKSNVETKDGYTKLTFVDGNPIFNVTDLYDSKKVVEAHVQLYDENQKTIELYMVPLDLQ